MTGHRRHARLISAGSAALCIRALDWLNADRWRDIAARLAGVAFAGWMLGGMAFAAPVLLYPATAAWLVAAWRTGRAAERREHNELAFVQLLADLIGDRNGVLLADVVAVLQEQNAAVQIEHVRAQCEALDIPVRDKLKVAGSVSVGVHVDDLTDAWDVQASPTPPDPAREWHAAVTRHNYPTTSDSEADVDQGEGVNEGCSDD